MRGAAKLLSAIAGLALLHGCHGTGGECCDIGIHSGSNPNVTRYPKRFWKTPETKPLWDTYREVLEADEAPNQSTPTKESILVCSECYELCTGMKKPLDPCSYCAVELAWFEKEEVIPVPTNEETKKRRVLAQYFDYVFHYLKKKHLIINSDGTMRFHATCWSRLVNKYKSSFEQQYPSDQFFCDVCYQAAKKSECRRFNTKDENFSVFLEWLKTVVGLDETQISALAGTCEKAVICPRHLNLDGDIKMKSYKRAGFVWRKFEDFVSKGGMEAWEANQKEWQAELVKRKSLVSFSDEQAKGSVMCDFMRECLVFGDVFLLFLAFAVFAGLW